MKTNKLPIFLLVCGTLCASSYAQQAASLPEAPSTVQAIYIDASAERVLKPGEKISSLYTRNVNDEYVLQRLTERSYWFQRQNYGTMFYVGDKGVLLFDPLEARGEHVSKAIARVTSKPVTALVYSHAHADHIADAAVFVTAARSAKVNLRIIASKATADKLAFLGSKLPRATETVSWPRGSFRFEGLTVNLHGFSQAAHTDDHGIWLLTQEKVAHLPDLINPDQPPFWAFAGSERFTYYEANLNQLADLQWDHLSSGHGNVGSKADVQFYRTFVADLKQAVAKAMGEVQWGTGVEASKVNAHTAFLPAWLAEIAKRATSDLRPKYGNYYGFEAATPRNAEMVAQTMFSYK